MKKYIALSAGAALVAVFAVTASILLTVANMSSAEEEDALALEVQLYVAPLKVVKKEKIRIDWDSQGADYCTASGSWSGKKEPSGSVRVPAKKKTEVFTLQCFDEDGNASEKITRKVAVVATKKQLKRKTLEAPKPLITGPVYATDDHDIVISWSSTKGTAACRTSGPEDWEGLKSSSGSDTFQAAIGSEYRLSCWNENGQEGRSTVYTVKAKPNKYTATSPGVGLSSEYVPMYPDDAATSALAEGNGVYFIDFVKIKENGPSIADDEYYWGKRVVLNIYTNGIIDNKDILEEVFAAPGQVPPDVDPVTKRIFAKKNLEERTNNEMWRFINWGYEDTRYGEIPALSPDDFGRLAVGYTLEYLELADDFRKYYTPSPNVFWYNGAVAGPPVFAIVDVYNDVDERIRRVVMDAYTGEDMTDKHIFDGEGFNGVIWDRTIMKERDETVAPVSNPPTQTPVIPPVTEIKTDEQKTTTTCQSGFVWSPTLGQCYEDTNANRGVETRPTCTAGSSYSITLKTCVED